MRNMFIKICKKCGGKCCKSTIFLTQRDVDKWKPYIDRFGVRREGAGFMLVHDGKCPFLDTRTGCTLDEKTKPFDCVLFPLGFVYINGTFDFFLKDKCPYINEIPKNWISKTKKWALRELKSWSEEERMTYSE
jgi:Fe-S-cluster containining protein